MSSTSYPSILQQITAQYSLYSGCSIGVIGIISNILNILVFTKLKIFRDNRCVLYLTVESVCNLINEIADLVISIVPIIYGDNITSQSSFWCRSRYIIFQTTSSVTCSMICFAACDQFCSTNYRISLRQICTLKLGQYLVILSSSIWLVHSIVLSSFSVVHPLLGCVISNPTWIQYLTYFFYPVLVGLLPIIIAATFSLLAFRNVRRIIRRQIPIERRRFDHQITAMVLARVALYIILALPYTSYRIYSININTTQVDMLRSAIERLIQTISYSINSLNYALNFYLFLISSPRYRRQVKYVLRRKYWRPIINWRPGTDNQVRPENIRVSEEILELE